MQLQTPRTLWQGDQLDGAGLCDQVDEAGGVQHPNALNSAAPGCQYNASGTGCSIHSDYSNRDVESASLSATPLHFAESSRLRPSGTLMLPFCAPAPLWLQAPNSSASSQQHGNSVSNLPPFEADGSGAQYEQAGGSATSSHLAESSQTEPDLQ